MFTLERVFELKEKKNLSDLTFDDVLLIFEVVARFLKTSPNAKDLSIEDNSILIYVEECEEPLYLSITNGILEYGKGFRDFTNCVIKSNTSVLYNCAIGKSEIFNEYFSGALELEGDFHKLIQLLEILILALDFFDIVKINERRMMTDKEAIKKILNLYQAGSNFVEPFHIPIFFDVFTAFTNVNPIAQKFILDSKHVIFIEIKDVGSFTIQISDKKMDWYKGAPSKCSLRLELDLPLATEVILYGDIVTSYMAGNIQLDGEEAVASALFLQELIQIFLEFLNLREFI